MDYTCSTGVVENSLLSLFISHRNESILGLYDSVIYTGYALSIDSAANTSGLVQAYMDCVVPYDTCNITQLNKSILYDGQYGIGCYLGLANGPFELTDDQAALLSALFSLNETAFNDSIAGDCYAL